MMEPSSGNWELDSDEIASIASEDLHQHRPNRWTGPKSSWRTLTEEDRLLWQSMKQVQDRDLAVHLYNAFALKRQGRDPATVQDLAMQLENGQQAVWVPPKLWTAWPLKHKQVPNSRLINSQHDEDEGLTFRRQEEALPSIELEEELSASILRTATRRFRRRRNKVALQSIETPAPDEGGDEEMDNQSHRESSADPEAKEEDGEVLGANEPASKPSTRRQAKTYEPIASSNDTLSYNLLRPSVRHILSQLDTTLSILNNSRVSGLTYLSDSSTEEESDSQAGAKRPRGRPRKQPGGMTDADTTDADPESTLRRRPGRPRKTRIPEEGETHEEMLHRLARESHRRLPTTPRDRDTAFEEWLRKGDEASKREHSLSRPGEASQPEDTAEEASIGANMPNRKKLARWGLRDWSDILGAAALAGFPSDVVARATRRCADLFGEGMVLRKLNEAPAQASGGIETVEYRPQPIRLSSPSEADDESDGAADLVQRRVASRQASLARSSIERSSPESFRGRLSGTQSPALVPKSPRSRSDSRSRSAGGLVFCPIPSCDRAAQGFARKANLRRHLELVHQGKTEEVDSDDELVGAVHVDGFLRPIVPARGWRGEDTIVRKRKRLYGQRAKAGSRTTSSGDSS